MKPVVLWSLTNTDNRTVTCTLEEQESSVHVLTIQFDEFEVLRELHYLAAEATRQADRLRSTLQSQGWRQAS